MTDPTTRAPEPPAGHGLLTGKVVVVTAAAGTGIGFATAKRCLEEGATVVVSDAHERRLGEAADALAEVPGADGVRPLAVPGRGLGRPVGTGGGVGHRRSPLGSGGSPRTRSPMMFFWISLEPP